MDQACRCHASAERPHHVSEEAGGTGTPAEFATLEKKSSRIAYFHVTLVSLLVPLSLGVVDAPTAPASRAFGTVAEKQAPRPHPLSLRPREDASNEGTVIPIASF